MRCIGRNKEGRNNIYIRRKLVGLVGLITPHPCPKSI